MIFGIDVENFECIKELRVVDIVHAHMLRHYIELFLKGWQVSDFNELYLFSEPNVELIDEVSGKFDSWTDDKRVEFCNWLDEIKLEWFWDHFGPFTVDVLELPKDNLWIEGYEPLGILARFTTLTRPLPEKHQSPDINYLILFRLNEKYKISAIQLSYAESKIDMETVICHRVDFEKV